MIWKYFLPFGGLSFQFLDGVIGSAKFYKFDEIQCVCFFYRLYFLCYSLKVIASSKASLVAQTVVQTTKSPPLMQDTWFDPWVRKIPLEKGMATYSSILARRIPWTEDPWSCKESDMTEQLTQGHQYWKQDHESPLFLVAPWHFLIGQDVL